MLKKKRDKVYKKKKKGNQLTYILNILNLDLLMILPQMINQFAFPKCTYNSNATFQLI